MPFAPGERYSLLTGVRQHVGACVRTRLHPRRSGSFLPAAVRMFGRASVHGSMATPALMIPSDGRAYVAIEWRVDGDVANPRATTNPCAPCQPSNEAATGRIPALISARKVVNFSCRAQQGQSPGAVSREGVIQFARSEKHMTSQAFVGDRSCYVSMNHPGAARSAFLLSWRYQHSFM
jgi:hypothetical protein